MTALNGKAVEAKTKASTTAAGVGSFVLLVVLGLVDKQDLLNHIPDGLTATVTAGILAGVTFLSGYARAHVPAKLSQSAIDALTKLRRGDTN